MSTLPPKNEDYGTQVYWEARYAAEEDEAFDWFKSFADLASVFETWIPDKGASILHLGCGNSTLPEDMYCLF